jgi:murein DD-endopeptidase MepM/ murein hydrolase activator NlpD
MKQLMYLLLLATCLVTTASGKSNSLPSNYFTITLSNSVIKQGQTLTVFLTSANRLKQVELEALGQKLPMYHMWHKEEPHLFRAFVGIPARTRPGTYRIVARAVDINQQPLGIHATITVEDARFKIQQITLSKKKTKLLDYEQLRKEGRILKKHFQKKDRKVYFASPFQRPTEGRTSSAFGLRRQYNGDAISSYHKGLDIANRTGTPIHAANGGKVSLAAVWKSHGKTVLINHGHGIVTVYIHMDKILVKTGEWVKRGQTIGRIGSTGIASGPHLHFGLSINDIRINPDQWIKNRVRLHF